MNEACGHWHAVYSAAAIAVGTNNAAPMGTTASVPTANQTTIANSKLKLKMLIKWSN